MNDKDQHQQKGSTDSRSEGDSLYGVIVALDQLFSLVIEQVTAIKQLAIAETKLSMRYVLIAVMASLCIAILVVCTWVTLLVVAGWYIFQLGLPVGASILLLLGGQTIALWLSYRIAHQAINKIGLHETQKAIKTAVVVSHSTSNHSFDTAHDSNTSSHVH